MNKKEMKFFEALAKDRRESANMLEKPSMKGIKGSVVEKYSDQAHFIYELLQNADDAGATEVHFKLSKSRLVFEHNGTRRFSISNPSKEDKDAAEGTLGDINAITAIANSSKEKESTIGKFGVGFKAVFQYTATPAIYDDNVRFKIERFIVPSLLEKDYLGRKPKTTVFVFPFDHPDKDPEQSVEEITQKLDSLILPNLFLPNIRQISYECINHSGKYKKEIEKTFDFSGVHIEKICMIQNLSRSIKKERLWVFTKPVEKDQVYAVGIFTDKKGKIIQKQYPAFCFFPTKVVTGLNFIIHAPFLLTDSREGIRENAVFNEQMIGMLAELSGDALLCLKEIGEKENTKYLDDNILQIVPIPKEQGTSSVSGLMIFERFSHAIQKVLSFQSIIPCADGYTDAYHAVWIGSSPLCKLLDCSQLRELSGIEDARFVFANIGKKDTARGHYIEALLKNRVTEDDLIDNITGSFTENQSLEWLSKLYGYIAESPSRIKRIREKPVFLDSKCKAAAAFDESNEILFLPNSYVDGYRMLNSNLMRFESAKTLTSILGLREPTMRDEIYHIILPQYEKNKVNDHDAAFQKILRYYIDCPQSERGEYITLLKEYRIIECRLGRGRKKRFKPADAYFPSDELKEYFNGYNVPFAIIDDYDDAQAEDFIKMIKELGVRQTPAILTEKKDKIRLQELSPELFAAWNSYSALSEASIEGYENILSKATKSKSDSVVLWNALLSVAAMFEDKESMEKALSCVLSYRKDGRCKEQKTYFQSNCLEKLRKTQWIILKGGKFESPENASVKKLPRDYSISHPAASILLGVLGLLDISLVDESVTPEQAQALTFAHLLIEAGVTEREFNSFLNKRKKRLEKKDKERTVDKERIIDEISEMHPSKVDKSAKKEVDEDEFTVPAVSYSKKIEEAKQKSADEIDLIMQYEELENALHETPKYTFAWFKILLEMELFSRSDGKKSDEISISFSGVKREQGTSRTLVLYYPSRSIPSAIEDISDIPLTIELEDQNKRVIVEAANIKSYTVRVKLKSMDELTGLDLSKIKEARLDVKNPNFLLEGLKKEFFNLKYEDNFNMQTGLPQNIEFIYGPPGTGKTTYLAEKVILPIACKETSSLLILTPTNKAADVLVKKIIELHGSVPSWLLRFGSVGDSKIEEVYSDKRVTSEQLKHGVVVTTIARYSYDYFLIDKNKRLPLTSAKWNYVIIDEASMVAIANVVHVLYKARPKKYYIAGDPLQIEPITSVDYWKNENIYSMVQLKSFSDIRTIPHNYKVTRLTTQYRSIPEIGQVYNNLSYDGLLKHKRTKNSIRKLSIKGIQSLKPITFLKFPVSKYESIYRPKRLQGKSNYQIYSAIFVFEFLKYMSKNYRIKDENQSVTVGVIAPYKAQADLVDRMVTNEAFPRGFNVQVGTIHSFQGDECDIIIALFNTPAKVSASKSIFLNKRNIINVAISRARDYLFIVMPDDNTEKIDELEILKRLETICHESCQCLVVDTPDIEKKLFGNRKYIENNAFSTTHQNVNVYGTPEMKYEIRSEDSAIDIQIHK